MYHESDGSSLARIGRGGFGPGGAPHPILSGIRRAMVEATVTVADAKSDEAALLPMAVEIKIRLNNLCFKNTGIKYISDAQIENGFAFLPGMR